MKNKNPLIFHLLIQVRRERREGGERERVRRREGSTERERGEGTHDKGRKERGKSE